MISDKLQLIFRLSLLISMLFALVACLLHYKSLDKGLKIFAIYIVVSFADETLAYFAALVFRNNYPVFFVYGIIEIVLISLFFNEVIDVFRKNGIGIYIGIVAAALGIVNGLLIQSVNALNHYFLFVESIIIVSMALFFFARLMLTMPANQLVYYNPRFLIAALLTFFWTSNFFTWGMLYYNTRSEMPFQTSVTFMIESVNVVYYFGVGIVFLLYPKLCGIK